MVSRNLGFRFTLVSYNILSQTLLNDHSYLYTSCNPNDLEWPKRGHRIVTELVNNKADIICLQEVESEHLQSLYRPRLAHHGYECLYKQKTGYKIDGCAIFYKAKLFHLLNYKGIEFNRTDVTNLLNKDNVGIIAVLRPKLESKIEPPQLVIANTHLLFNPKRSDIRIAQLKLFLTELEEISLQHYDSINDKKSHHPTILCGDMNSVPESNVNKFIIRNLDDRVRTKDSSQEQAKNTSPERSTEQVLDDNHIREGLSEEEFERSCLDDVSHTFHFKSVYPPSTRDGKKYVSTSFSSIVDYIFYTPKLRLESYRALLTEDQLRDIGPIPNSEYPSDHLTLEAQFSFRPYFRQLVG